MLVEEVLARKGHVVHTIAPDATLLDVALVLMDLAIGALVCTDAAGGIVGIVSERDLARAMARFGAEAVGKPVAEVMTRDVVACSPSDKVEDLLDIMTETRCRHLPVVSEGMAVGMVSIGDLVKVRRD